MDPSLHEFGCGRGEQCLASMSPAYPGEGAHHGAEGVAPLIGRECSEGFGDSVDELLARPQVFMLRNEPGHAGYRRKPGFLTVPKFLIEKGYGIARCSHGN